MTPSKQTKAQLAAENARLRRTLVRQARRAEEPGPLPATDAARPQDATAALAAALVFLPGAWRELRLRAP